MRNTKRFWSLTFLGALTLSGCGNAPVQDSPTPTVTPPDSSTPAVFPEPSTGTPVSSPTPTVPPETPSPESPEPPTATPVSSPTPTVPPEDLDSDGFSSWDGDCDDLNDAAFPGATEIPYDEVDQDCDGEDLTDIDGDGYDATVAGGTDCNDQNASIMPDATEVYNGADDDCDGLIDEGTSFPLSFQIGSTGIDYCKDIAVDSAGNIILAGYFSGTVDVDPGPGVTELTAVGITDYFLAKYDTQGQLLWAFRTGGAAADLPHSVVVDAAGDIFTAGYFTGLNVDFAPGAGQTLRSSNGGWDAFVARYSPDGILRWVVTFGNTVSGNATNEESFDLRVDSAGNTSVIGSFEGTIDAGGGTLSSAGGRDIFLATYDPNGNHLWSRSFGGTGADNGYAVAFDKTGNLYAAGAFTGSVAVGGAALTNRGGADIFLARFDAEGNHVWSTSMGGTSSVDTVRPGCLEVDAQDRLYLGGSYGGIVDFNSDPIASNNLTSTGSGNFFVARYDTKGAYSWAIGIGGDGTNGPDGSHRMAVDPDGNVYVTGFFTDSNVDFDPGPGVSLLSAKGTGSGTTDIFVAKYSVDGIYNWAYGYGAPVTGEDQFSLGGGIELEPGGTVIVGGRFFGTIDWDPGIGSRQLTSAGESDSFLVRYYLDGTLR